MKPKQQYIVLSFIILTLFLASQINFNCPFFWDEAWSYMRTIDWMGHHNITLNPVAIDPDISRAHPLGFYAFVSLFAKVFGSSNCFFHLFMFIANSVLIFLFTWEFSTEKNTKQSILILALFIFQGVTITQLPFVLPEIFIALLSTLAVLYFFHSRLLPFLLTSIAVVLIKESSIVLLVTLWAYGLLRLFKKKGSMLLLIGLAIPYGS